MIGPIRAFCKHCAKEYTSGDCIENECPECQQERLSAPNTPPDAAQCAREAAEIIYFDRCSWRIHSNPGIAIANIEAVIRDAITRAHSTEPPADGAKIPLTDALQDAMTRLWLELELPPEKILKAARLIEEVLASQNSRPAEVQEDKFTELFDKYGEACLDLTNLQNDKADVERKLAEAEAGRVKQKRFIAHLYKETQVAEGRVAEAEKRCAQQDKEIEGLRVGVDGLIEALRKIATSHPINDEPLAKHFNEVAAKALKQYRSTTSPAQEGKENPNDHR